MKDEIRITLRIPPDLHGVINDIADHNQTSMNGQIITLLRRAISDDYRIADLERRLAELEAAARTRHE